MHAYASTAEIQGHGAEHHPGASQADRAHVPDARNKRQEIKEVSAGDIAAFVGLKDTGTGDASGRRRGIPVVLERMAFPVPVMEHLGRAENQGSRSRK